MKLNIGSGAALIEGYDNADIDPSIDGLTHVCELDDVPVEADTYDEVRASHVIEHVPVSRAVSALAEWRRVLRSGGFVWIDTPNFARTVRMYADNEWLADFNRLTPEQRDICSLRGIPNRMLWANFKVFSTDATWNTHYANYDSELLTGLLICAGFVACEVLQTDPSLIVRAVKP